MRTVICVPWGTEYSDECPYRVAAWKTVRAHLELHHPDWPLIIGENHDERFNIARARNDAAEKTGDWDVAVFADSDTLIHPDDLRAAVSAAIAENKMCIAGDAKIYMDERSSGQFIDTGLMFPVPTDWSDTRPQQGHFDSASYYKDPCSGYVVVTRDVWAKSGGYWDGADPNDSFEDLVFMMCCSIFAGSTRTPGLQAHLWHPGALRYKGVNHGHYRRLAGMKNRPNVARQYLAKIGHVVP